jgi:hypothetical protein
MVTDRGANAALPVAAVTDALLADAALQHVTGVDVLLPHLDEGRVLSDHYERTP